MGIYSPLYSTLTYGPVILLLNSSKNILDANSTYYVIQFTIVSFLLRYLFA